MSLLASFQRDASKAAGTTIQPVMTAVLNQFRIDELIAVARLDQQAKNQEASTRLFEQ